MERIGAFAAKTHLSRLLERVAAGETVIITKHGRPVAELRPVGRKGRARKPGCLKGRIRMSRDFDEPLEDLREYME